MKKSITSILLSSALLICTFSTGAKGAAQEESLISSYGAQRSTMIVRLSAPSLIDHLNENGKKYKNISELILSDDGKQYSDKILAAQENVKNRISSLVDDADFSESRSFTAITNGFTLTADINDIEIIEKISGVDSVIVSKTIKYDDPSEPGDSEDNNTVSEQNDAFENEEESSEDGEDTSDNEEESEASEQEASEIRTDDTQTKDYDSFQLVQKKDVNVVPAYEAGYTGKGMLIGIIDSEFDVTHMVFSTSPDEIVYDKDYVRSVHRSAKLNISDKFSIDDIYYNGKIIYSYDYGEDDRKVKSKTSHHGTHVSGIAAGNSTSADDVIFKGMAYDAQLAFFKISDANDELKDEYILSALDDVIKISPDVINCSYGAVQYLMHDYEGRQLYEKIINSGIAVIAAAGNEDYNGSGSYKSGVPAWYSTYGTVSLPSALEGSLSVAASVPEYSFQNVITMTANDERNINFEKIFANIEFDDIYGDDLFMGSKQKASDVSETKYIYYEDIDTIEKFNNIASEEINDKIVILNENSFIAEELIKNAARSDVYAIMIIKSDSDSRYEQNDIESDFFVYTVDNSEKEYFSAHPEGTLRIVIEDALETKKEKKGKEMAYFSSYGTKADLSLKPDITAPGDNILSSLSHDNFRTYELLSGTSMSTPCLTGAYSIMKQYVTETGITDNMSPKSAEEFIYKLMMSTSKLIEYPDSKTDKLYYSPRLQGSGLLDLGAAIKTKAVLSVKDKRPKASLLDSSTGSYSFEFSVTSFSDEPMTFDLGYFIQTDSYTENIKQNSLHKYINTLTPEDIRRHAKVYFKVNGNKTRSLTLAPGSTEIIKTVIRLDQDFIEERKKVFTNGFYVDGFVTLDSKDNPELSLPFSGFCGEWSSSHIFPENPLYEKREFPSITSSLSIVSSFDNQNTFSETTHKNIFQYDDLPKTIAFGKNSLKSFRHIPSEVFSNPSILLPNIFILRDAMDYTISISDNMGTQLLCQNFGDIPSNINPLYPPYDYFVSQNHLNQLEQYYSFINNAREGSYIYTLTASTVGTDGNPDRTESVSMKINIDNTSPRITDIYLEKTKNGELFLNIEATDNLLLQGINFFAVQRNDYGEISARQEIYEKILSYFDNPEINEKFAEYSYDNETKKYYFRYSMSRFKRFLNNLKNQSSEVYIDDDVTIIFENDTDFSSIDTGTIAIEPVDYAYLCGEEQIINLDAYGEASFTLIDPYGEPLSDIEVLINGKRYFSDDNGSVSIRNLPMGRNRLTILSPYVRKNMNPFYDFILSSGSYKYSKTIKLYKTRSTDTGTGQEQEPTRIVNFDTGDHNTHRVIFISLSAILSASLTFTCMKRKKHKSKKD